MSVGLFFSVTDTVAQHDSFAVRAFGDGYRHHTLEFDTRRLYDGLTDLYDRCGLTVKTVK